MKNRGLVKTIHFNNETYIGDPMNTIRIFNEKGVDELMLLNIDSNRFENQIDFGFLRELASECFMPLAYGGGIQRLSDIETIINLGIEKVVMNSALEENEDLLSLAAKAFGSQALIAALDIKKDWLGRFVATTHSGRQKSMFSPQKLAKRFERLGAGELLINDIDRDGTMQGYNLKLVNQIAMATDIPVIACGGAGTLEHIKQVIEDAKASAAGAGSLFVYHGQQKGILVNYPSRTTLKRLFEP